MLKKYLWYIFIPSAVGVIFFTAVIISGTGNFRAVGFRQAVYYLVLSPVLEEIVFRGGLQNLFCNRFSSLIIANVAASAIFAASHLFYSPVAHAVAVFFPSLVFGFLYGKTGSVVPGIIVHSVFNLNVFIAYQSNIIGKIF